MSNNDPEARRRKAAYDRQRYLKRRAAGIVRGPTSEAQKRYTQTYQAKPINRAKQMHGASCRRAKVAGIEFTLSVERVKLALIIGVCERTGVPFNFTKHETYYRQPYGPSIDRKNAFEGYTDDNVQIVCNAYNMGKMQMTDEEFLDFCRAAVAADDARKAKP
jgi:hypothetical protein